MFYWNLRTQWPLTWLEITLNCVCMSTLSTLLSLFRWQWLFFVHSFARQTKIDVAIGLPCCQSKNNLILISTCVCQELLLQVRDQAEFVFTWISNEFHETCHFVTFIVLVNSHHRWKQTRNRLWCELTLALRCHRIIWSLLSWNRM